MCASEVDVLVFWGLGFRASLKHTRLAEGLDQGSGIEGCGSKSEVGEPKQVSLLYCAHVFYSLMSATMLSLCGGLHMGWGHC